jgi:hypothetical protein
MDFLSQLASAKICGLEGAKDAHDTLIYQFGNKKLRKEHGYFFCLTMKCMSIS